MAVFGAARRALFVGDGFGAKGTVMGTFGVGIARLGRRPVRLVAAGHGVLL